MTINGPPELLGHVDHLNPLAGLEHVNVIPRDIFILSTPPSSNKNDDDLSWQDLTVIITENNLSELKRRPADLRNYLRWKHYIEQTRLKGGVLEFMVTERLHWLSDEKSDTIKVLPPKDETFMKCVQHDFKILANDFPYAMQPGIVHVVVWTRTKIPIDPETGDLTSHSRDLINRYVDATFVKNIGLESRNSVLWFKNWAALQSIPALEHFHVLLHNPNLPELQKLYNTGGVQINL